MGQIADLFSKTPSNIGFRSGVVKAWNSSTGANTIEVAGSRLTNLPVLITTAVPTLAVNDVVALLRVRNQYVILGRFVEPPF